MAVDSPIYRLVPRQRYDTFASPESRVFQAEQQESMKRSAKQMPSQAEQDAEVIKQRKSRRAKSDKLREKAMPKSAQELADRTADLGDVFRLFPNEADSFLDEWLNPMVAIGNMAASLGRAPLSVQQGNYGDAAMAVATPLAIGAAEALVAPVAKSAGQYITTQTPVRDAYKLNPFAYTGNTDMLYRGVGAEGMQDAMNIGYFRARPDVPKEYFPNSTLRMDKSFGDVTYWSPDPNVARTYSDVIAEVPSNVANFKNRYKKSDWSKLTSQQIPVEKARFVEPHWLYGLREISRK